MEAISVLGFIVAFMTGLLLVAFMVNYICDNFNYRTQVLATLFVFIVSTLIFIGSLK